MLDGLYIGTESLTGDYATVLYRIQLLGFNAIRVPFSFQASACSLTQLTCLPAAALVFAATQALPLTPCVVFCTAAPRCRPAAGAAQPAAGSTLPAVPAVQVLFNSQPTDFTRACTTSPDSEIEGNVTPPGVTIPDGTALPGLVSRDLLAAVPLRPAKQAALAATTLLQRAYLTLQLALGTGLHCWH